jgi:hypothetical protein
MLPAGEIIENKESTADKLLSAMRHAFGGHVERK